MTLPDRSVRRPTFAEVFADASLPGVSAWIDGLKGKIDPYLYDKFKASLPDGKDGTLLGLLTALAHKSKSPLVMVNDLQTVLDWPVNDDLYDILKSHATYVDAVTLRRQTIEWVMKTGTRFNPKVGEQITFYDTTKNMHRGGTVKSVDKPIATAIVQVGDVKVAVEAERVA